jgi:hypothetical protein
MKMKKNDLKKILNRFSDSVKITYCDNKDNKHGIFEISWSEHGRGFGTYTFYQNKKGKWMIDNECDGKECIKRVMCKLIDSLPMDVEYDN